MAILRSYSAAFEQNGFANSAVTRWRFNEDAGTTTALDSVDALDGNYRAGANPGDLGTIGDGAARFDGTTGRVLVSDTLSGTITVAAFGDSLVVNTGIQDTLQRYVPELEAALEARGLSANVLPHGVSGNTSTQGLARIQNVIDDSPDVAIVEFGTNDARAQTPLNTVEDNLSAIDGGLQNAGIEVLLTGTFGFFPGLATNQGYATELERDAFEAIFQTVATDLGADLLDSG